MDVDETIVVFDASPSMAGVVSKGPGRTQFDGVANEGTAFVITALIFFTGCLWLIGHV